MYSYLKSDAKRIEFNLHTGQERSLTQLIAIYLTTDLQTPFYILSPHRAAGFLVSIIVGFPAIQHLFSGLFALVLAVIFSINRHILQVDWLPFFQFFSPEMCAWGSCGLMQYHDVCPDLVLHYWHDPLTCVSGLMGALDTVVSEVGKMCNNDTALLYLFINTFIYPVSG